MEGKVTNLIVMRVRYRAALFCEHLSDFMVEIA